MSSATFNPLSMADGCLTSLPTLFTTKSSYPFLSLPSKPLKLVPLTSSSSSPLWVSLKNKQSSSTIVPLVASTSDWAQKGETNQVKWENEEGDETAAAWEGGEESGEEEAEEADGFEEETEVESYPEPPEEAKLFVGNLSFDIDSEKLAGIFEQAGVVEVAEVIYNRDTEQSRGFGFVTMSTVEEAEKAVEMFNRYDVNGRLLTVNKAAPRGSRPERTPRAFGPALRLYVGNLPWGVDDALLEQLFSEYGKVVDARVVFDRESGRSRGFGFVTMATQSELDDAIAGLDGQSVEGRAIRVNVAEERPPRRSF